MSGMVWVGWVIFVSKAFLVGKVTGKRGVLLGSKTHWKGWPRVFGHSLLNHEPLARNDDGF